jgi:hypothetical protein
LDLDSLFLLLSKFCQFGRIQCCRHVSLVFSVGIPLPVHLVSMASNFFVTVCEENNLVFYPWQVFKESLIFLSKAEPGNPYRRVRNSTIELLVLTSSNQLLLLLKVYFSFFTKQAILTRRSTVPSLPFQQEFTGAYTLCPLHHRQRLLA